MKIPQVDLFGTAFCRSGDIDRCGQRSDAGLRVTEATTISEEATRADSKSLFIFQSTAEAKVEDEAVAWQRRLTLEHRTRRSA